MSNTPQPPADGWQPPQSPQEPPVYRPHEQPPTEEPPPWSPESQRVSPPTSQPPQQQVPVEDIDGTVKYVNGPGSQPQAPFGPPPGVPVSPFDAPPQQPGMPPVSGMPAPGMPPVSGMPAPGMPPVSGMPASGVPVSPGQGQFGPQGGQLVPVSGPAGQPWGGAQPGQIQRKKKRGGKGPLWMLLAGVVVIAAALAVGGFILFNPDGGGDTGDDKSATIENPAPPEPALVGADAEGLKYVVPDSAAWPEATEAPALFTAAAGRALEDGEAAAFVGALDPAALGAAEGAALADLGPGFQAAIAEHLGGEITGEPEVVSYWIDARGAQFHTFTVGETAVYAAIVEVGDGRFDGFVAYGPEAQAETFDAMRGSLRFGDL
ncbi:MAG TPA: hypothetical protein VFU12_10115 [Glycomyces sp.]|nr:hypothetical protein [Glycomyces sp.]